MNKTIAEYPFDKYYLYKVFHKKEQRQYAVLYPINKDDGLKRTTLSYARYLMSVKEKRFLNEDEEIDHIDNDKTNDDINNLQIITPLKNKLKQATIVGSEWVVLKCPNCNKIFERKKKNTHLTKGHGKSTSCCRKCASIFGAKLYWNPNDESLLNALHNNVIKVYRKYIDCA